MGLWATKGNKKKTRKLMCTHLDNTVSYLSLARMLSCPLPDAKSDQFITFSVSGIPRFLYDVNALYL